MRRYEALLRYTAVLLLSAATACGDGDNEPPTPPAAPPKEIEVDASRTLYGFVGDTAGNPVEGVVVSDGFQCAATDARGIYQMERSAEAEYVYFSYPAEFKIRRGADGYPDFYARLDASQQRIRQDFTLERLAAAERKFRLICIGDPQPAKAEEAVRFERETMVDVRRTAAASEVPCYGVALGDLTGEKPDLLAQVRRALGSAGIPVFALAGNHDKYKVTDATPRDAAYFSYTIGPLDYSFNRGDVHVVCMDDVRYTSGTEYTNGFTDAQLAWLRADLSFVPKDKTIVLCYHIPLRDGTARNMAAVKALLAEYAEAHLMAAHTHYNENFINTDAAGGIYEHIHGAPCGVFWHSALNGDGAPNGYAVYDVEGAAITNWRYKSSLHDESFQIRLHRGGDTHCGFTYPHTPETVIANIWNADPRWTVTLWENGVQTKTMRLETQYTDAWAVGYHVGVLGRGDNYKSPCKHLYTAEPDDAKAALKVVAVDGWGNRYEQTAFTAPDDFSEAESPVYR